MPSVDWGSVPEWLAGVAAIIALLFARGAVIASRATNEQQSRQIEALERAESERVYQDRSRYASHVACWITLADDEHGVSRPAIGIVNSNDVPAYKVTIYAGNLQKATSETYNFVGPLSGRRILHRPSGKLRAILPAADNDTLLSSGGLWVAMTFRDTSGNWWYRSASGGLHEAVDESHAQVQCRQTMPDSAMFEGEDS